MFLPHVLLSRGWTDTVSLTDLAVINYETFILHHNQDISSPASDAVIPEYLLHPILCGPMILKRYKKNCMTP